MKRIGDVSRHRRFHNGHRKAWYAKYRAMRFSRRFLGGKVEIKR